MSKENSLLDLAKLAEDKEFLPALEKIYEERSKIEERTIETNL